ncbi:MAG: dihydroxyacetone kinase family protein [Bifidobacteriaceae bacterium]|jgi:dihydroxyacetone kinase|nr:dihydroxyacetone kinase family protein [Bifidobacteriaceae bacterium]
MTYLYNDPTAFTDEMIEGFVAAYPERVRAVSGGVVRATKVPEGQVSVVIGGGTGHYPAFGGLVGPGLAHGAAMGNVFASPSTQQIVSVAKAANSGGGILFCYGNYAGDVLNFDEAQVRLIAEGIDCRTVTVTDDISSAPAADAAKRRGIAGDLCVFKAAAYAAEQGRALEAVWRFARFANARTRSFGVAFSGCTLPGASEPLFAVPEGRMDVGMGIHGEPGLRQEDVGSAEEIAQLLVAGLLAETPDGAGCRVAVLTNGLGSVKYEELFVLHRSVNRLLHEAGLEIVEPDVGEMCTSFEMAGASLTLFWMDEDLEAAWRAPADSPAYRKGSIAPQELADGGGSASANDADQAVWASQESRTAAVAVGRAVAAAADAIDATADDLGKLDQVAGDGDHGIGMRRGAAAARKAAADALAAGAGAGSVLSAAGEAWSDRAGGTSGALWGLILGTLGSQIGDRERPDAQRVAAGVTAAAAAVQRFGKAQVGDKTLVDTLVPFAAALSRSASSGQPLAEAWAEAAAVARGAAAATADLIPKIGRARPHAEKSVGTPDPGAVSMATIVEAVAPVLGAQEP